jgi:hypothetical protein
MINKCLWQMRWPVAYQQYNIFHLVKSNDNIFIWYEAMLPLANQQYIIIYSFGLKQDDLWQTNNATYSFGMQQNGLLLVSNTIIFN